MLITKISFIGSLAAANENPDSHIDVLISTDDDFLYMVTVGTAKAVDYLMDKEKKNSFGLNYPWIIVKELTQEIIEETLKDYAAYNDGYFLKLYHFVKKIDETVFDQLKAEEIENEDKYGDDEDYIYTEDDFTYFY